MSDRAPALLVLALVAALGAAALLREPLLTPYREHVAAIARDRETVAGLERQIAERRAGHETQAELAESFGLPLAAGEPPRRAAELVGRLQSLAEGCGLKVDSVQPRIEAADGDGLVRFPVQLNLSGDTRALVAFLVQIQAAGEVLALDHCTVHRQEQAKQPLAISALLTSYGVLDNAGRAALAKAARKGNGKAVP
jgi:Tfp pilus assembly protein PilO